MPDNAGLAIAFFIVCVDCLDDLSYSKELLIAGDFFRIQVINNKIFREVQKPFRVEQRNNIFILHSNFPVFDNFA
jgi:hypothetical protein